MKIACIIPSRYASTRLPGKPLRMIAGKTLVRRVYERAILAKLPDVVIVATDHKDIEKEEKTSETTEVVNKSQEVESDAKNIVSKNSDNLEKSNVTTNVSEPKKKTVRKKSLSRKSVSVIIPKKTNMNDDDDESCGFTGNSPPR